MAQDNKSLGKFILDGIPQAPRGAPQVEVTFDIDANGILNVTAKDKATDKAQSMQIIPSSGLTDTEIEQMVKDAELHEQDDSKRRSIIEAKNRAENLIFATEKTLNEQGENIREDLKQEIQAKLEALKSVKETGDIDAITRSTTELGQVIQQVGEQMYGAAPGATDEDSTPPPDEDDVVEGDFSKT
jgi:molecular chaperone DnaK